MAEVKLPRILAAAKEFNIGKETLIDFLESKGFAKKGEIKDQTKLSEEMYRSAMQEFQSDKVAKLKSDQIDLPKGVAADLKKKKDEEEIIFKKEKEKPVKKEEPKEEVPVPPPPPIVVEQPVVVVEPELTKAEIPELEGPKVINKIDLSTIDSSTRPKKESKKKEEKAEEKEEKKPAKKKGKKEEVIEQPVEEVKQEIIVPEEPVEEAPPVIENIKADKLEGPKILGKIELPVENDTRPKHDEKHKRKRIPIAKKEVKREDAIKDKDRREDRFKRDDRRGGPGGGPSRGGPGGGPSGGPGRSGPGQSAGGGRRDMRPREDKVIDEKEIQEKIRETQAKLAGAGGRGKSLKAKYRKAKREEAAEAAGDSDEGNKLQLTEFISVSELANLMDVNFTDVISKCMGLGIMVSINQRLDAEVIELVASEFGFDVEFIDMEKQMEMEDVDDEDDDEEELQSRSPIVTIMGHVDHGKTSLLDYIRRANVVAGEAGGITQHIGAYQVELPNGKEITFLDTPGHEAFTAMRARGAKVTDIAVIVIAADDAVMPQTKEAISHAQAAGVPMIFAINKIDRDGANSQKIYEQLSQMNLLVEAWGGKFQSQEISAKKGLNVDQLLEKILLEAELLDLKANPDREASGTIIEATLDKGRGYVATVLVQNGTLKQGDIVVAGQHFGRVKAMFNERNKRVEDVPPSAPVLILGLNGAPQAGEKFKVYDDEAEAKEIAYRRAQILREQGIRTKKHITLDEIGRRLALGNFKELNLILKGDVDGSVEALADSLLKLSTEEIQIKIIHKGVGAISESDVLLATASDAIVIGFNVRPSQNARKIAETESIQIKLY